MKATLCYTRATGMWTDRRWNQIGVGLEEERHGYVASVELPMETTAAFINVTDDRGLLVSSTHIQP